TLTWAKFNRVTAATALFNRERCARWQITYIHQEDLARASMQFSDHALRMRIFRERNYDDHVCLARALPARCHHLLERGERPLVVGLEFTAQLVELRELFADGLHLRGERVS